MSTLDRLRLLRAHLVRNWDVAEDWTRSMHARDGSPCLMVVTISRSLTALDFVVGYHRSPEYGAIMEAVGFDPLEDFVTCLTHRGKDGLKVVLDRAIARLEEHVVSEGGAARDAAMSQRNVGNREAVSAPSK